MKRIKDYKANLLLFRKDIPKVYRLWLGAFAFVIILCIWSFLSYGGYIKPIFLPTPTSVIKETVILFTQYNLLSDIGASIFRVVVGFMLSSIIAFPLGILMGTYRSADAFLHPITVFMRNMPVAAFIPLLILWLGIGHVQKIALLFIGVFFYLLALNVNVVANVREELLETASTLGASKLQLICKVLVPASLPGIFDNMRALIGAAWTYIVVAELVAAESGLGKMIIESQRFLKTPRVIAGILIIGVIGLLSDAVFRFTRPLFFPWTES